MIGKTLANYEILGRLGSGGMAEIYRARDLKLGREIALKVLPADLARNPERRRRFHREAKALANLKHPNIVTLYTAEEEGDVLFLTMELVEGKTVRELLPEGGFPLREILKIGIPLVDALAYAHKQGVTHRDLKLTNVMVDQEGRPMVLDFGLVKLFESEDAILPEADPHVTGEGRVIGTAAYMSPEQAEGRPVDGRSDIFSLGIVLYEMATGKRPFKGDSSVSTISAILRDDPPQVHEVNHVLPRHLGRIIHRCLAKDPGRRYQVAADLRNELVDLKEEITSATGTDVFDEGPAGGPRRRRSNPLWVGAAVGGFAVILMLWQPWAGRQSRDQLGAVDAGSPAGNPSRTMIVVLPFENLGPPEDAYFAGGVTQEINNALASVSNLGVISRTSASKYMGTQKTVREIGNELGVDYVVEGSVRWQKGTDGPDRVRITPQLIRVADDTQLWSDQYDRELEDIFEIQSEIAAEIVNRLGEALAMGGSAPTMGGPPTENVEAYQEYLRATYLWERASTDADWDSLFAGYRRALELDPNFLDAWTKLSMAHSRLYHNFEDRSEERLVQARKAADRIFEIAPGHPKGHVALGHYYYWGLKDYDQALAEFAKTGSLLESDADVISAIAYINRRRVGKMEEALEQLEKALHLSPRDPLLAQEVAFTLMCLRRFDRAASAYDVAIALAPEEDSYYQNKATNALYRTGDGAAAESVAVAAPSFTDEDWNYFRSMYLVFAGKFEEALAFLEEHPNPTQEGPTQYLPMTLWSALISSQTPDGDRTRKLAEAALEDIEDRIAENPEDARYRLAAAQANALLGNAEEALRQGNLATELVPLSKDALRAFDFKWRLGEVAAMVGESDLALDLVEEILGLPGGVSAAYLKNDPWLASIHEDPRFVALVNGAS